MIAKDCINCIEQDCDDMGYECEPYYRCSWYRKKVLSCGDDCPKYKSINHDENIRKFKEE